jgi:hypothetical protein
MDVRCCYEYLLCYLSYRVVILCVIRLWYSVFFVLCWILSVCCLCAVDTSDVMIYFEDGMGPFGMSKSLTLVESVACTVWWCGTTPLVNAYSYKLSTGPCDICFLCMKSVRSAREVHGVALSLAKLSVGEERAARRGIVSGGSRHG